MDTGSAPDIRRRPHRTRKWRPAADDLGRRFLLFKSPDRAPEFLIYLIWLQKIPPPNVRQNAAPLAASGATIPDGEVPEKAAAHITPVLQASKKV
jgi:hypothetical protein